MIAEIKRHHPNLKVIWRCHIGLDTENDATCAAWSFLRPYVQQADAVVFSAKGEKLSVLPVAAVGAPGAAALRAFRG
jgi:hypothetical protein